MKKSRIVLTACLAGIVATGCGGGGKNSHSGSNASCNLTSDKAEIKSGSEVKFTLKANFPVTRVKLDNIQMYDKTSGLDLSTASGTDQQIFEKQFSLKVSEEKDIVAAVSSDGSEVLCSSPIKLKEEFRPDFSSDGDLSSLFDLTSTEPSQGKKQVVYKCIVPNEFEYKDTILKSYGPSSCSIATPASEITANPPIGNEVPEEYDASGAYADRTPTLKGFGITKIDGDQTDSAFTWNTSNSAIHWAGFTNYSDCHTSKAEMVYRERNNEVKTALLVWDHVQDPLTKAMIPKLRVSPDYPKGINIRGAQASKMAMYFYCNWNHEPRNLVVAGAYSIALPGTFAPNDSLKFDVSLVLNGEALSSHSEISYDDFRRISTALSVSKNDVLKATITIKDADNRVLLSNDKSVVDSDPARQEKWNQDCERKIIDNLQILKDSSSVKDEILTSTVRLKLKLCDFSNSFEMKTKKVETKKIEVVKHQVIVKCPITATLSSGTQGYLYSSYGESRCDYANPADDLAAVNLIPKSYAKDGPLSEAKPTIKDAKLNNSAGAVGIAWSGMTTQFIGFMNCHKLKYEVQYNRGGQIKSATIGYGRYFDDSDPNIANANVAQKWNLTTGQDAPTAAEVFAVNDKKFAIYFYCDWYPNEKIGEGVSPF
jgi:hypothetical protein